jgi:hypothetical protein
MRYGSFARIKVFVIMAQRALHAGVVSRLTVW